MTQYKLEFFCNEEPMEKKTEEYIVPDARYTPMRCDKQIMEVGYYSCFHELVLDMIPSILPDKPEGIKRSIMKKIEAKVLRVCRNPTRFYLEYKDKWSEEDLEIFRLHGVKC